MNSRERVLCSLNHVQPDRVPVDLQYTPEIAQILMRHFNTKDIEDVWKGLDVDCRWIGPGYKGPVAKVFPDGSYEGWGGSVWRTVKNLYGSYDEVVKYIADEAETPEDLDRLLRLPDDDDYNYEDIAEGCRRYNDYFLIAGGASMFFYPTMVRNMENILIDMALNPDLAEALFRKSVDWHLKHHERILDAGKGRIDAIQIADDFSTQRGPLFSVEMFRAYFESFFKLFVDMGKSHGAKIYLHCCGSSYAFIPDLIRWGVEILDPIQISAADMEPGNLKTKFGDRLSFHGGVETQSVLPNGKPDEVRAHEAQCLEPDYHLALYDAVKAFDDTRPVFEDYLVGDRKTFKPDEIFKYVLCKDDFTYMEHYLSYDGQGEPHFSTIHINDAVVPLAGKPYGITEADWMRCSTHAGLTYFAITTALARAQGASDIRPYVLLSSWVSSVPGVKTTDILTEENRRPVYGEDNTPDLWALPGIQLLQKTCAPLFAMDYEFWQMNKHSNAWGHFPVTSPCVDALSEVAREITVFNDDLQGDDLVLQWQLTEGSVSNRIWDKGEAAMSIKPGYMEKIYINFTTPKFNTFVFLTLRLFKNGVERFTDGFTCYEVINGLDFTSEFNGEERVFK